MVPSISPRAHQRRAPFVETSIRPRPPARTAEGAEACVPRKTHQTDDLRRSSPACEFSPHFLMVLFQRRKVFNSDEVQVIYSVPCVIAEKAWPTARSRSITLSSSQGFRLQLTTMSLVCFESAAAAYGERKGSHFILWRGDSQLFLHHLLKRLFSLQLSSHPIESPSTTNLWSLDCFGNACPASTALRWPLWPEVEERQSSNTVLLRGCSGYSGSLEFP